MEAPPLAQLGDGLCRPPSPEGETVCAALARYEHTLRDAIREVHLDLSAFKLGVERRLEEAAGPSGPLGRAVAQLQQENRQLRNQLEALTQQVELLSRGGCDPAPAPMDHDQNHKNGLGQEKPMQEVKGQAHLHARPCSLGALSYGGPLGDPAGPPPPSSSSSSSPGGSGSPAGSRVSSMISSSSPSTTRFSSRATFAVSSKMNSIEREEPIEVDPAPPHTGLENGATTELPMVLQEDEPPGPSDLPHQHLAPVAMRMPHLPITATTKTAELRGSPGSPGSPGSSGSPVGSRSSPDPEEAPCSPGLSNPTVHQYQPIEEFPLQSVSSVKTWTPTPVRTMGSPRLHEKTNSSPVKSVAQSGLQLLDRDGDLSGGGGGRVFGLMGERRRELVRSQTLPRNIGAQARRSVFHRLDSDASNGRPKPEETKAKLKRSQSFGVSSASSIKQILLEWCRSKTLGYQNIDIVNFSSSWSDGLAFCALVHSFFPTEFDYTALLPLNPKHNFELAFGTAEVKAGCDRLIEVDDMMIMGRKPDPMCVFTYVQSLYNHLRKFE